MHREGAITLKCNAYNGIYSGYLLECIHMFNDNLDDRRISLMADRYYIYIKRFDPKIVLLHRCQILRQIK